MHDWLERPLMISAIAVVVCSVFVVLGAWHFYMAFAGHSGESAAVPSRDGKPTFVPSTGSTIAVGIVLLLFAVLVAGTSGMLLLGLPRRLLAWLSYALALGLLARAVGEFNYLGFFKRVRGTPFARMDTLVYSPLCLALSAGVTAVAMHAR
jgi:Protein of unknown function (DUF3995)